MRSGTWVLPAARWSGRRTESGQHHEPRERRSSSRAASGWRNSALVRQWQDDSRRPRAVKQVPRATRPSRRRIGDALDW